MGFKVLIFSSKGGVSPRTVFFLARLCKNLCMKSHYIISGFFCFFVLAACGKEGAVFGDCQDQIDNDGDGLVDCDDADCIVRNRCEGQPDTGITVDTDKGEALCEPCLGETTGWAKVEAGNDLTCGLTQFNTIQCWGENGANQLAVPEGILFEGLAVGGYHV